jgi:PEP-CTERM motif-containing protein
MRRACMALALIAVMPLAARAEPITVNLASSANATYTGSATTDKYTVDLGELSLSGSTSTAVFYFEDLKQNVDYTINLDVLNASGLQDLRFEVLDPVDGDDTWDPAQPGYVPAGYSTSNRFDGFSFAQDHGLERSARFAGGSGTVVADEKTHRGDILMFSGLSGAEEARLTFGLRDYWGGRGFLVRVTATGGLDAAQNPEPASMVLLGTGLVGMVAAYRRRRSARQA